MRIAQAKPKVFIPYFIIKNPSPLHCNHRTFIMAIYSHKVPPSGEAIIEKKSVFRVEVMIMCRW